MPGLPRTLSDILGKDITTVRRWLRAGLIPGAYRTKGGHWRIRNFSKLSMATVLKIQKRVSGFARKRQPTSFDGTGLQTIPAEWATATDMMFAAHKVTLERLVKEHWPEQTRALFLETRIGDAMPPGYLEAAKRPQTKLYIAGCAIVERTQSCKGLTAGAIAAELGISRASLYKKYKGEIRQAIQGVISQYSSA